MDGILSSLTDAQRQAVQHVDGPLLILAGPGSGKTRVVTHRVAYLLAAGHPRPADRGARLSRTRRPTRCGRDWIGWPRDTASGWARSTASVRGCCGSTRRSSDCARTSPFTTPTTVRNCCGRRFDDADVELMHETPARIAAAISWAKNDLITAGRLPGRRRQSARVRRGPRLSASTSGGCWRRTPWISTTC